MKGVKMKQNFMFKKDKEEIKLEKVKKWKVLIADDEEQVHEITKLVLKSVKFNGLKIEFIDTYSEEETKEVLRMTSDIAVLFLDVVMENDDSGLNIVKYLRDELKNNTTQIIMRTGQTFESPPKEIIENYEINDFKEKAGLTSDKLYMSLIQGLRSYKNLDQLNKSKRVLKGIVTVSSDLFLENNSINNFTDNSLKYLISFLDSENIPSSGFAVIEEMGNFKIVAGTFEYSNHINSSLKSAVSEKVYKKIEEAHKEEKSFIEKRELFGYFKSRNGIKNLLYAKTEIDLSEIDKKLLKVFSKQLTSAFENICLKQEIIDTQKEIILKLGEVVETRSKDTANHVLRVSEYSEIIASGLNLGKKQQELLKSASPMHDIGKIGIPDAILKKPGKLTKEEFEIIKNHTTIGFKIFEKSEYQILKAASIIARGHHEKWDGTGYPDGLRGEEIHIFARIVAVADVFDALTNKRVYKAPWGVDDAINLIKKGRGFHFDPKVVDVFLDNLDEILKVKDLYSRV